MQSDELKGANLKIEELLRVRDSHLKQMKYFEYIRTEMEQQTQALTAEVNTLKNGENNFERDCGSGK